MDTSTDNWIQGDMFIYQQKKYVFIGNGLSLGMFVRRFKEGTEFYMKPTTMKRWRKIPKEDWKSSAGIYEGQV